MYCVIFGIPRGLFTISSAAFMAHPIFNPEKPSEPEAPSSKVDAEKDIKQEEKS